MFFLQAPAVGDGSGLIAFIFPFLILIVFYFFMIRPQINRQKEQQKFTESLAPGMDVVTASGIIGKIIKLEGNIAYLGIDEKTKIKVLRNSITGEHKAA